MAFGLFARSIKSELSCPVCQLGFSHSISRKDLEAVTLDANNIAILDEHDCPFCRHHFFVITTDKQSLITQERDWNQKIEQLEDRLLVINEMFDDAHNTVGEQDKQRLAQLQLHAEVTRKRISELEQEFEEHCKKWHARMQTAQLK